MDTQDKRNYMINVNADGQVTMRGGLIFYPGGYLFSERPKEATPSHAFEGGYVIHSLPKWWQCKQWWRLIRLIQQRMTPNV